MSYNIADSAWKDGQTILFILIFLFLVQQCFG